MFYKVNVDIANTKSMWEFLKEHFTYSTMNSWNGMRSIANNVKLYNLKLEGDWTVALRYLNDEADSGCLQIYIDDEIQEFESAHPYYKVGFNGRSGGYLVLYNSDNYRSVLPDCVDNYDNYAEFKADVKAYGERLCDYKQELRKAVAVVRDFDRLCDSLRDLVNEYSKRSFDVDKLEVAIESFNLTYGDDLDSLGLTGPIMEGDKVELNCLSKYQAFLQCFLRCLGEDRSRVAISDGYLWLKEY